MMIAALILTLLSSPPSFHIGKYLRADLRVSLNADVNAQDDFDVGPRAVRSPGEISKAFPIRSRTGLSMINAPMEGRIPRSEPYR